MDVTASTVANIGPGIDFYFAFGVIAVLAGVAAPLTIIAGGVAVVLLAFTVAEFTKVEPSAGSFITYVETGLGSESRWSPLRCSSSSDTRWPSQGSLPCRAGTAALTLAHYTSWHPHWSALLPPDKWRHLVDDSRRQTVHDVRGGCS